MVIKLLKLKYYSLSKEEKFVLKDKFYQTEYGNNIKKRLDRVFIIGILGTIFSIYLFILPNNKWDVVEGIILLIASFIFIFGSHKVRINKINTFLTQKKK